jgi:hypothetical protein
MTEDCEIYSLTLNLARALEARISELKILLRKLSNLPEILKF